jgi:hypothetical protein
MVAHCVPLGTSRSGVRPTTRLSPSRRGRTAGSPEQARHLAAQLGERAFVGGGSGADQQPSVLDPERWRKLGDDRTQPPSEQVASCRRTDRATDREGDAKWRRRGIVEKGAPQGLGSRLAAGSCQCLERPATADRPDQADSRVRPLSRRARMIARPARVRMRARKPCLRARRRVLGWNVRFTGSRPSRACFDGGQAPCAATAMPAGGRRLNAPRLGCCRAVRQLRQGPPLPSVTADDGRIACRWRAATIAASARTTRSSTPTPPRTGACGAMVGVGGLPHPVRNLWTAMGHGST